MKLLLCLLISVNCLASDFKFNYGDIVRVIKNETPDDEFYKCNTREYKIIGYRISSDNKVYYRLTSTDDSAKCDRFYPESNIAKKESK
jgi:hypothetical protein